jgi:hypothetical protein
MSDPGVVDIQKWQRQLPTPDSSNIITMIVTTSKAPAPRWMWTTVKSNHDHEGAGEDAAANSK